MASEIIAKFESTYTTVDLMTVHQGKLHHYLGITLNCQVEGEVQIMIYDDIKELIDSLLEALKGFKHHLHFYSTQTLKRQ